MKNYQKKLQEKLPLSFEDRFLRAVDFTNEKTRPFQNFSELAKNLRKGGLFKFHLIIIDFKGKEIKAQVNPKLNKSQKRKNLQL